MVGKLEAPVMVLEYFPLETAGAWAVVSLGLKLVVRQCKAGLAGNDQGDRGGIHN